MELCTYLYYLRVLTRLKAVGLNHRYIKLEDCQAVKEEIIVPDNLTYHGEQCTSFFDPNYCIRVPYHIKERDGMLKEDFSIRHFDDHMELRIGRVLDYMDTQTFLTLANLLKTCNYPRMGAFSEEGQEPIFEYRDAMQEFLSDSMKEQLDGYIMAAVLVLRSGKYGT